MFHRKSNFVGRLRMLHSLLDGVLANHVNDDYLAYHKIAKNVRFYKYLEVLAEFDRESLHNEQERMASWINAYNALAIKGVIDGVTPVAASSFAGSSTAPAAKK